MRQFTENVILLFLATSPLKLCFTNPSVFVLAVKVQTDLLSYWFIVLMGQPVMHYVIGVVCLVSE